MDELAEDALTELMKPRNMGTGFAMNTLGGVGATEGGYFSSVFRDAQPAVNHRLIDFQMKLKAIDIGAVTKGLMGAQCRKSEVTRRPRHVEGVAVPLKNPLARPKFRE